MRYWLNIETRRGGRAVDRRSFDSRGQRFVKIGTMPTADILLEEPRASRLHAMIEMGTGGAEIRDLGTMIGTKLNELPVTCEPVTSGDRIRIGGTVLRLSVLEASEVTVPPIETGPAWLAKIAPLPARCHEEVQVFLDYLCFRETGERPVAAAAAAEPTGDAAPAPVPEGTWPPRGALRFVESPAVENEKYDTGRIVAQMQRSRRRSGAGALVALVVMLAAVGVLSTLSRAIGLDTAPTARSAASLFAERAPSPEPPPASEPPASEPPALTHTVVGGDTLSGIAKRYLGDMKLAPLVFEANRDRLADPSKIEVGMVLRIPVPRGEERSAGD
jgi:hypothetical protein